MKPYQLCLSVLACCTALSEAATLPKYSISSSRPSLAVHSSTESISSPCTKKTTSKTHSSKVPPSLASHTPKTKTSKISKSLNASSIAAAGSCHSTITTTVVTTVTPATLTTTFEVIGSDDFINGDDFEYIPIFKPTTVYTTSVYTTVSGTTTIISTTTPTTTIGAFSTVTVPTPSGYLPIRTTLPDGSDRSGLAGPDPVQKRELVPRADCVITKTITSSIVLSTPTTTFTTTLTGELLVYPAQQTTFDDTGESIFQSTYTPAPVYTASGTLTVTEYTNYEVSVVTETRYTYTVTGTTTTVYAACATNNFALDYNINGTIPTTSSDYHYLTDSGGVRQDVTHDNAYECCAAAIQAGGVGFWQWTPLGCFFTFAAADNTCTQAAANYTVKYAGYNDDALPRSTGNGLCGEVTDAVYYADTTT